MRYRIAGALGLAILVVGCSEAPTAPAGDELVLALEAQTIAQRTAATSGATHDGWIRRLLEALRTTDDPEAQACLAEARELRHQAREAAAAGDHERARALLRDAFRKVLCAVIEVFPNAPARTGAAVDEALARIDARLGDRDAPRLRRVLAHVRELRTGADRALAAGDPVTALALNLRGLEILHELREHVRHARPGEHDGAADAQMEAVRY